MFEHGARTVAYQMAQIRRHNRLMAVGGQYDVERGQQVRGGIDKGSVEVENDAQGRIRHGEGSLLAEAGNSAGAKGT